MNKEDQINQLIIAAITTASAVFVPILFHLLGLGSIFLPMFIPLSIGSFFMNPVVALCTGAIAPISSSLLTSMPPLYPPIALIMLVELSLFCYVISLLKHTFNVNTYVTMIIAILFDRIILYILYACIMPHFKISFVLFSIYDLFKSFPGIILLLTITPVAVNGIDTVIKRYQGSNYD